MTPKTTQDKINSMTTNGSISARNTTKTETIIDLTNVTDRIIILNCKAKFIRHTSTGTSSCRCDLILNGTNINGSSSSLTIDMKVVNYSPYLSTVTLIIDTINKFISCIWYESGNESAKNFTDTIYYDTLTTIQGKVISQNSNVTSEIDYSILNSK